MVSKRNWVLVMKLLNIFKKQKTRFITKELISLSSLANIPTIDYFKDNNQVLLLIDLFKKEYLEILIKEKVLTSKDLKANELHNKLKMIHTLIEQNTLGDQLFEKVFFDEQDKVKALIHLRKFAIYNEQIKDLEEEIISRIIALKEILKKTFLNKQKRLSIINEINNLTNIFVILMNQKETLRLCLNNHSLKCFDITKEKDLEKEEKFIKVRKEELNAYQMQAFGEIVYQINDFNDMAKVEVALEDYVYNYKEPTNLYIGDAIMVLRDSIELDLKHKETNFKEVYVKILELENKCKIFYEFGKNILDKEDLKKLYRLKFKYFTTLRYKYNDPILIEPFINEKMSQLELETYEESVFELINAINTSSHQFLTLTWTFGEDSFILIRLLKKELQTDRKYEPKEILKNKYKLNLLIAFSYPYPLNVKTIKEIYKKIYVKKSDYPEVNFYEPEFTWNEDLPLETINELKLMQKQTQDLGLYLFLKQPYHDFNQENIYYLPKGLNEVGNLISIYGYAGKKSKEMSEIRKFVEILRENMERKDVVFPNSLKAVFGDLLGDAAILNLQLNDGLEYFKFDFMPEANIRSIEIPSSVKFLCSYYQHQNSNKLRKMEFRDFDKSCFYNNLKNLTDIFSPYVKVTSLEKIGEGDNIKWRRLYELTIDNIIINFSNIDYPGFIIISNDECKVEHTSFSIDSNCLIAKINDLIMEQIAKYRGIEKRKLTKH